MKTEPERERERRGTIKGERKGGTEGEKEQDRKDGKDERGYRTGNERRFRESRGCSRWHGGMKWGKHSPGLWRLVSGLS